MKAIIQRLREFTALRDWQRYHTPDALARSVAIEAGELLECYQWPGLFNEPAAVDEVADVMIYCLMWFDRLGINPTEAINAKIDKNATKHPPPTRHTNHTDKAP